MLPVFSKYNGFLWVPILIFGQKSYYLGPTIFKISQPNWHYCRPKGTIRDVGTVSTNFWCNFDFTLWIIHLNYKIFLKLEFSFPQQDLLTFLQPCFSGDTVTWLHSSRVCWKVSLLGVDSLWGDCMFILVDWGSFCCRNWWRWILN